MNVFGWLKKIGPLHAYKVGKSKTVCGVPMLGNNYCPSGVPFANLVRDQVEPNVCDECSELLSTSKIENSPLALSTDSKR